MSYLNHGHSIDYLHKLKDGQIPKGLGLGNPFIDQHVLFKRSQIVMILGFDNVGKTELILWYYLMLSMHHGLKWNIWSGENGSHGIMKKLIQFYARKPFYRLSHEEINNYYEKIFPYFNFLDNKRLYDFRELLDLFGSNDADGCLIDPYTGLKRGYGHSDNYDFLNESREWVNKTGKTLYVNTHPATSSGRTSVWAKGHDLAGYTMPPRKADTEGGLSFANRADDFWVVHRYTQHPSRNTLTEWHVVKNKDNDSGGGQTMMDTPMYCEFNNGLGFMVNGLGCYPNDNHFLRETPLASLVTTPPPIVTQSDIFSAPNDDDFIMIKDSPF
jgi:hypothetical protein